MQRWDHGKIFGVAPTMFLFNVLIFKYETIEDNTVVKWGHTEGIPREKTLSEKYTEISF